MKLIDIVINIFKKVAVKETMSVSSNSSNTQNSTDIQDFLTIENIDNFLENDISISENELKEDTAYILKLLNDEINTVTKNNENLEKQNSRMKDELTSYKKETWELWNAMYELEKELAALQQYSRRENLEICGIPEYITDKNLENYVIDVFQSIGLIVSSYDISACHRLKKTDKSKPPSVIVRFVNRQNTDYALRNRKYLRETVYYKLFIVENLCPKYRTIFSRCEKLKAENRIKSVWTHNGVVNIKRNDNTWEKNIRLLHVDELNELFPFG